MTLRYFQVDDLELVMIDTPHLRASPDVELSEAEQQILEYLCEGHTTSEIAAARGTSAKTVSNQLGHLYRRFGVMSRFELISKLASRDLER